MKKRLVLILCALACVGLLSGCWQVEPLEEESPELLQPGEIREEDGKRSLLPEQLALPYAPDQSLDPVTCPDGMQQVVSSLICEGLFRLGPDFEPQPWLCADYTASEDFTSYTFVLREGVTFSDGSPLTAADVRSALNRARTSERYQARLSGITAVSAGEGSVTVILSSPNSGLPALLDIPIVKAGSEALPIGTGPYLLSQTEAGACLVANQTWWQGTRQPTDRIALVEAADLDTMLYRFTSRDVQLITADLTGTSPISVTGDISYTDTDTTVFQYIGCNVTRQPLDDPAFRRALWIGTNRNRIVSAFLSGHGDATQFPVSPASPLYPSGLERSYSRDDLTAALNLSSYTGSRTLTLLVNEENSFKTSVANELAESFADAGIAISVRVLPWEEYTAALAAGNFDLYYGEVRLSADWDLSALLSTGGALNYGGWSNETTDRLLAAYAGAGDRAAAMETLCRHLQEQAPIIPVCFKSTSVLTQSGVLENLTSTAAEPFYGLTDCTVHLREK